MSQPVHFGLLLFLCHFLVARAVVHQIPMSPNRVLPGSPQHRHLSRHFNHHYEASAPGLVPSRRIPRSVSVPAEYSYSMSYMNITIGTPPQEFVVVVDFFFSGKLAVIGVEANMSNVLVGLPPKRVFDSNASTSYVAGERNISEWYGQGQEGKDLVNISVTTQNMSIAVLNEIDFIINYFPDDGVLGLAPPNEDDSQIDLTVLIQLEDTLDEPVLSISSNVTRNGTGTGLATLGALNTVHCEANWTYVPHERNTYESYRVHLASVNASDSNGNQSVVGLNSSLVVAPYLPYIYVPDSVAELLRNLSGAVYNPSNGLYEIDCDPTLTGEVTLNIGGNSDVADNTTQQLTLTALDFIGYSESYDVCYIVFVSGSISNDIYVGRQFANNHCVAYNIQDKTVGFADSIEKPIDREYMY